MGKKYLVIGMLNMITLTELSTGRGMVGEGCHLFSNQCNENESNHFNTVLTV